MESHDEEEEFTDHAPLREGEIPIETIGARIIAPPSGARVGVDTVEDLVDITVNNNQLSQRLLITSEQARAIGNRLLESADQAEQYEEQSR